MQKVHLLFVLFSFLLYSSPPIYHLTTNMFIRIFSTMNKSVLASRDVNLRTQTFPFNRVADFLDFFKKTMHITYVTRRKKLYISFLRLLIFCFILNLCVILYLLIFSVIFLCFRFTRNCLHLCDNECLCDIQYIKSM